MPVARFDAIQKQKLLEEYTALAASYDQRWSAYLESSLRLTLEKVADLPAEGVLDVACTTGAPGFRYYSRNPRLG